jgi:hypothetical protein
MLFSSQHVALVATALISALASASGKPVSDQDQSRASDEATISASLLGGINVTAAGDIGLASGCNQGRCPDFEQGLDMLHYRDPGFGDRYMIRVKHENAGCRECLEFGPGPCASASMCGQTLDVCVDRERNRAHRIINGQRACFYLERQQVCLSPPATFTYVWRITQKLDRCTW